MNIYIVILLCAHKMYATSFTIVINKVLIIINVSDMRAGQFW